MNNWQYLYEDYSKNDTIKDYTIDFIVSHPFPVYEKINWKNHFVHNTTSNNLDSIVSDGILISKNTSNSFTWAVNPTKIDTPNLSRAWSGYGGNSIVFKYDGKKGRLNDREFAIFDDIPPKDIVFIDMIMATEGGDNAPHRMSEVLDMCREYGYQEIYDCYYTEELKPSFLTMEQYQRLFDFVKENL